MSKEQVMSAIDTIDLAFVNFMVVDIDYPRARLYTEGPDNPLEDGEQPSPEYIRHLCNEAMHSGKRMGRITARVCNDLDALRERRSRLSLHTCTVMNLQ